MINELIFTLHTITMSIFALVCLRLGKGALTTFVTVCCILANLFVVKQITLCGLAATASDSYSIGAVLGLNLIQEYYDRASAQKTILISFIVLIFYCIASQLHLAYDPCITNTIHEHYAAILESMPRIVIASLLVYALVQYFDSWFYGILKRRLQEKYLILRNILSIAICQLLDTALFSYLGLYDIVNNLMHIIIVSYAVKLAAIGFAVPFLALSKKIMRKNPE